MTAATGRYLSPAIRQLPGLISYCAGAFPDGSTVHVSLWQSGQHARQMSTLKKMIVDARAAAEKAGVTFLPIINYPPSIGPCDRRSGGRPGSRAQRADDRERDLDPPADSR